MNAPTARPTAHRRPFPLSRLALGAVLALGAATSAQAQSLVELYEAARGFDATYLAARSQYDANLFRAEQARAGLLPEVGLGAAASWARRETNVRCTEASARESVACESGSSSSGNAAPKSAT